MSDELMVFDWEKAARLILEAEPHVARAGIVGNDPSIWAATSAAIYSDGVPVLGNPPLTLCIASDRSVPTLEIDGVKHDCYRPQSESPWTALSYWPRVALSILYTPRPATTGVLDGDWGES